MHSIFPQQRETESERLIPKAGIFSIDRASHSDQTTQGVGVVVLGNGRHGSKG